MHFQTPCAQTGAAVERGAGRLGIRNDVNSDLIQMAMGGKTIEIAFEQSRIGDRSENQGTRQRRSQRNRPMSATVRIFCFEDASTRKCSDDREAPRELRGKFCLCPIPIQALLAKNRDESKTLAAAYAGRFVSSMKASAFVTHSSAFATATW
jgi:hypothetical protein